MKKTTLLISFIAGLMLIAQPLFAHQPDLVNAAVKSKGSPIKGKFKTGVTKGGDAQATVTIKGYTSENAARNILVIFDGCTEDNPVQGKPVLNLDDIIDDPTVAPVFATSWTRPTPLWRACPGSDSYLIKAKSSINVPISIDFLRASDQGVMVNIRARAYVIDSREMSRAKAVEEDSKTDSDARSLAQKLAAVVDKSKPSGFVEVGLNYRLNAAKRSWTRGSYASIFGGGYDDTDVEVDELAGAFSDIAATEPVHLASYTRTIPGFNIEWDNGALLNTYYSGMISYGSGYGGESLYNEDLDYKYYPSLDSMDVRTEAAEYTITGKLSAKWTFDHAWHPAFGFDVEAWTRRNGSWVKMAHTIVGGNGRWTLRIPESENFDGSLLRIIYRAGQKGYYSIKTSDTNRTYKFRDTDRENIGVNYDFGHRTANTDGNAFSGVGELTETVMHQACKVYWGANINPVRENEMTIFYPNTRAVCNGQVWSCASRAGNVWLIQQHGVDPTVVVHELGHQLNNEYWEFDPLNTGGQHVFDSCYPGRLGMALKEGFANFLAGWVGYQSRDVADGNFSAGRYNLGFDLEQTDEPPECGEEGYSNEVWVARTLWDLHDTRRDGGDDIFFRHMGSVMAIYLRNGPSFEDEPMDIRDFEPVYQNAASDGHEDNVAAIFEQNAN